MLRRYWSRSIPVRPARGREQVQGRAEQQPIEDPQRTAGPRRDHQDRDGGGEKGCRGWPEPDGVHALADTPDGRYQEQERGEPGD